MERLGLTSTHPYGMPRRRVLTALVLVCTVLVCHGLFCTLHQFSEVEIPAVHHSSFFVEKGHAGEHSGGHVGVLDCAAVILAAFLAAVLRLLHKGTTMGRRVAAAYPLNRRFPLSVFHLPRGPTLASQLQVFRL
jgi:hypothetical protein